MYYQSCSALTQWLDLTDYAREFYALIEKSFRTFMLNLISTSVTISNDRIDMCLFLTVLAKQRALHFRHVNEARWTPGVKARMPTQVPLPAYDPTSLDCLLHALVARPSITAGKKRARHLETCAKKLWITPHPTLRINVFERHATEWWIG